MNEHGPILEQRVSTNRRQAPGELGILDTRATRGDLRHTSPLYRRTCLEVATGRNTSKCCFDYLEY